MNKRGLSTIITNLIVILLVFFIIGVIWVVVENIIVQDTEKSELIAQSFNEKIEILDVKADPSDNLILDLNLKKTKGVLVTESSNPIPIQFPEIDLISVSDLSGSMLCNVSWGCSFGDPFSDSGICSACGGEWQKPINNSILANRELISSLLIREENQIGLVGFNDKINVDGSYDLTDDEVILNIVIDNWLYQTTNFGGGGTCICCGINEAADKLKLQSSPDNTKVMIILSDGVPNKKCVRQGTSSASKDAIKAACEANNSLVNLTIYSIGLGDQVDEETMIEISKCGNGKYFKSDVSNIVDTYRNIVESIQTTHKEITLFRGLKIIFYDDKSNSEIVKIESPPTLIPYGYHFDLRGTGLNGRIKKIEIYPFYITNEGKEYEGVILNRWEERSYGIIGSIITKIRRD